MVVLSIIMFMFAGIVMSFLPMIIGLMGMLLIRLLMLMPGVVVCPVAVPVIVFSVTAVSVTMPVVMMIVSTAIIRIFY